VRDRAFVGNFVERILHFANRFDKVFDKVSKMLDLGIGFNIAEFSAV